MKIKLSWVILVVALIPTAALLLPRLKYSASSTGPSVSESARVEQATPEATVNTMFQMADQGGESGDPQTVIPDRLNNMHMIQGKDLTAEERKFVELFWDNFRAAAIYGYLRAGLTNSASITSNNVSGDSAVVVAEVNIYVESASEWTSSMYTVELRKRGANWYVDEMKTPKLPVGVYSAYKQRVGSSSIGR